MNTIKLVTFDMAGTTIQDNKEVETCFARACKKTGLSVSSEKILSLQGYSKKEVFRMLWGEEVGYYHPDFTNNVENSYGHFCMILEEHYNSTQIYPTEGCLELFSFLRQNNIKIALTTGFYRKVTNIILDKLGWLDALDEKYMNTSGEAIIDISIASDEVARGRPEPLMIQKAMQNLGIKNPKQVINIGDTPSDLISGNKADCLLSVGITNGTHTEAQLKNTEHNMLVCNLREFRAVIEGLFILEPEFA